MNLLGYVRGEFGLAENVRLFARALIAAGMPIALVDIDLNLPHGHADESLAWALTRHPVYELNLLFVNPDLLAKARHHVGEEVFRDRYTIAFWLWELEQFPEPWRAAIDVIDEVWVPSDFVRTAVASATSKPVTKLPKPIEFDLPVALPRCAPFEDDTFLFLFSFDFHSSMARKNPLAVVQAFRQAFNRGRTDVGLIIKSVNGEFFSEELERLVDLAARDPRILVDNRRLARSEMYALQSAADCYVSLHRSEGFGLGLAECMYLGKPVIATAYSGNLEFMTVENSALVDYRLVEVKPNEYPFWQGQRWAEPNVVDAARWMRKLADDRALAAALGARAAADIRRCFSGAACSEAVRKRTQEILST